LERFEIDLTLVVLAAGLAHAGWLASCLASRRYGLAASSILTACMLSIVLCLAASVSWAVAGQFPVPRLEQLVVPAALATWLAMRFGWRMWFRGCDRPGARQVYVLAHLLLLNAAGWQFYSVTAVRPDDLQVGLEVEYPMVAADDAMLVTDRGRVFSVFHFDSRERLYDDKFVPTYLDEAQQGQTTTNAAAKLRQTQYASLLRLSRIPVAPPDGTANCHGWVFTGGSYALSEAAVEALLVDNGYERVAEPQQGDVIVYRDDAGQIAHTGRVRRVYSSEEVWIESKWGSGSRYIHLPLDQCYSTTMEYYRSARPSDDAQLVRTMPTQDSQIALSDEMPVSLDRG
jgi:hypothetical protein